ASCSRPYRKPGGSARNPRHGIPSMKASEEGNRMTQPCVDVIILSWDRVPDTLQAIESASSQDGADVRVLVAEQGSLPDQFQELQRPLAGRPDVVLRCNTHNSGVAEGRNQASALGSAEFVAALDNDAVFADRHQLARAVAIMRGNPDLVALA